MIPCKRTPRESPRRTPHPGTSRYLGQVVTLGQRRACSASGSRNHHKHMQKHKSSMEQPYKYVYAVLQAVMAVNFYEQGTASGPRVGRLLVDSVAVWLETELPLKVAKHLTNYPFSRPTRVSTYRSIHSVFARDTDSNYRLSAHVTATIPIIKRTSHLAVFPSLHTSHISDRK